MLNALPAHILQTPTPFYLYNLPLLQQTLTTVANLSKGYNFHVHYALKANIDNTILSLINQAGFGADCVSGGEVQKALDTGFMPNNIVFAGVGKADDEINLALQNDIFCFNVESLPEMEVINQLAGNAGRKARIALRINPNVNANTHKYITTGLEENKFGINVWELPTVLEALKGLTNLQLLGLHFHIGSQITDMSAFKNLCLRVNELVQGLREQKIEISLINVGGGLGINYQNPDGEPMPNFEAYFGLFNTFLNRTQSVQVHFELGRALVAQAGTLVTRVIYIKKGIKTNFAIVDAGMNNLIRPALYQAYHKIESITNTATATEKYDVVGPICESSDCFGKAVSLPSTERGHLLAIRSAGAYGQVMESDYNLKARAGVVYLT